MGVPGRSCPLSYRYNPEDLASETHLRATTIFVVGCLYGNLAALAAVLDRAAEEDPTPTIVFNGDFHYLDTQDSAFSTVADTVAEHLATLGNVESELFAETSETGCGCGYPDYVDDAVVERSNAVVATLRKTASRHAERVALLSKLPKHLIIEMGGLRVGVVHGDPENLAGWSLALEALEPADAILRQATAWRGAPTTQPMVVDWLSRTQVRVLACTHTGLPYAQDYWVAGQRALVVNNGAAGLPAFEGCIQGVMTRVSIEPGIPIDSLYGTTIGPLRCDAVAVRYDNEAWMRQFLEAWPPGSPAHTSYAARMSNGTPLRLEQSIRFR